MPVERKKDQPKGDKPASGKDSPKDSPKDSSKDSSKERKDKAPEQGEQKKPRRAAAGSSSRPARGAAKETAARPKAKRAAGPKSEREPAKEPEAKAAGEEKAPARRRRRTPTRRKAPGEEQRRPARRPVVRAQAKYVRSSARKARLVIDHIRGKPVDEARAILRHTPRGVARDVEKLLASAVANAENNHELVGDELLVKEAYADEGPTLKRFRPRALGRATRIRKRTSHLTVTLTPKE
jgi:ribosomal protein L22